MGFCGNASVLWDIWINAEEVTKYNLEESFFLSIKHPLEMSHFEINSIARQTCWESSSMI